MELREGQEAASCKLGMRDAGRLSAGAPQSPARYQGSTPTRACRGHLPSASAEAGSRAVRLWPLTRAEGSSGWRVRRPALRGSWWDRSLDGNFQELTSWSQSLHLLKSRKAPFMIHRLLKPSRKPLVNQVLDRTKFPLHQNLMCWLSLSTSLEQFLRAIWGAVSWAEAFILPQIRHNLQHSCYASFFSWHKYTKVYLIF